MVQLTHPYMTTEKTIALTRQTFVDKVMSLVFKMMSRFVIAFLQWSKCLKSMAAVIVCSDSGSQENKTCHCFPFLPIYLSLLPLSPHLDIGDRSEGLAVDKWVRGACVSGATSARLVGEGESLWPGRKYPCLIRGPTGRPVGEQRG